MNSAQQLANTLVENAMRGPDIATSAIQIPLNWPSSAEFGVEYVLHDSQFPSVEHGTNIVYFDNVADLTQWLEEKREWIKSTDNDFSMRYSVYTWDWGPLFKYSKTM